MCGEPSETTLRTCRDPAPSSSSAATCAALRETSPPIEWPTSATSSTATGHSATTRLEQLGERAAVLGDVAAGVVADVDRRAAELAREPRAVVLAALARPRRQPRSVSHQAVEEDDEPRRRLPGTPRPARARSGATGRPPTRTAIGCCSGLPSRSRRSPTRPLRTARPMPPGSVADSGRSRARAAARPAPRRRGRRPLAAPPSAPTTPLRDRVVDELDRRAQRDVAERARRDVALHRADALA